MALSEYNKCKKHLCGCQRYLQKETTLDECFYCNHSIGYHESKTFNIIEHPFGSCNQFQCGCQRFKTNQILEPLQPLLCIYCNHFNGFHSDPPNNNNNNYSNSDNNINIPQTSPFTHTKNNKSFAEDNTVSRVNTTPTTIRKRRDYIPHPYKTTDTKRRAGRNPANGLKINTIICLNQEIPNNIPKSGSPFWNDLNSQNMIKNNVEISSKSSSTEIYNLISNLFSDYLNGRRWCLLNGSSGKLRKVGYDEITYDLIRNNITKTKKMYIAPDIFDIGSNPPPVPQSFDVFNGYNVFNGDDTGIPVLTLKGYKDLRLEDVVTFYDFIISNPLVI
ncbi:hypothetical protein C1645_802838, partial [Glomus cerebriforme]